MSKIDDIIDILERSGLSENDKKRLLKIFSDNERNFNDIDELLRKYDSAMNRRGGYFYEIARHSKEYREAIERLREENQRIRDLLERADEIKTRYNITPDDIKGKTKSEMESIRRKMDELEDKIKEAINNGNPYDEYSKKLDELRKVLNDNSSVDELQDKIDKLEGELEEANKNGLNTKDIEDRIKELKESLGKRKGIDELGSINQSLHDANESLNEHSEIIRDISAQYDVASDKAEGFGKSVSYVVIGLRDAWRYVKDVGNYWIQVQDRTFKTARAMGLTRDQAKALTVSQLENTKALAALYGATQEELIKFQQNYSEATGRATILTREETTSLVAMSKLSSEATAQEWVNSFDKLGMSVNTSADMMYIVQQRAKALGLNASKTMEVVGKNLGMLNKYTFKGGVDGLTRMALKAQELRVSMDAMVASVDKFNTIEGAITSSANLQMLGGNFTANFSNPMGVSYEAIADPEALARRIEATVSGMGSFNKATGEINISPIDLMRLSSAAESLGMSKEDLVQIAKSTTKNSVVSRQFEANANLSTDKERRRIEEAFLKNKAEYNTESGRYEVSIIGENGETTKKDVSAVTANEIAMSQGLEISEENAFKDIRAIREHLQGPLYQQLQEQASGMTSMKERWAGIKETFKAGSAAFIDGIMNIGDNLLKSLSSLAVKIPNALMFFGGAALSGIFGGLRQFIKSKFNIVDMARNHYMGGNIFGTGGRNTPRGGGSGGGGFRGRMSNFASSARNGARSAYNSMRGAASSVRSGLGGFGSRVGNAARGAYNSMRGAASTVASRAGNVARGTGNFIRGAGGKVLGGAAAGIISTIGAVMDIKSNNAQRKVSDKKVDETNVLNEKAKSRLKEKNKSEQIENNAAAVGKAVGATIGGIMGTAGGPLGSIAGGIIGNVVGGVGGKVVGKAINAVRSLSGEKRTEEEKAKSEIQVAWEKQKVGATTVEDPKIMEKAALSTIAIHDLLVTKFNKENGLREDGTRKGIGEKMSDSVSNFAKSIPIVGSFFSEGGIAKAANGMVVPGTSYIGDKVPAMLNSGEMVINPIQQRVLFSLIKNGSVSSDINNPLTSRVLDSINSLVGKNLSINSPEIRPLKAIGESSGVAPTRESNTFNTIGNVGPSDINLNVSGSIRLYGENSSANIDFNQLLNNEDFKRQLADIIKTKLNESGNSAKYNKESSNINTTKMYVGI